MVSNTILTPIKVIKLIKQVLSKVDQPVLNINHAQT